MTPDTIGGHVLAASTLPKINRHTMLEHLVEALYKTYNVTIEEEVRNTTTIDRVPTNREVISYSNDMEYIVVH